jgi:hypothetical protein
VTLIGEVEKAAIVIEAVKETRFAWRAEYPTFDGRPIEVRLTRQRR